MGSSLGCGVCSGSRSGAASARRDTGGQPSPPTDICRVCESRSLRLRRTSSCDLHRDVTVLSRACRGSRTESCCPRTSGARCCVGLLRGDGRARRGPTTVRSGGPGVQSNRDHDPVFGRTLASPGPGSLESGRSVTRIGMTPETAVLGSLAAGLVSACRPGPHLAPVPVRRHSGEGLRAVGDGRGSQGRLLSAPRVGIRPPDRTSSSPADRCRSLLRMDEERRPIGASVGPGASCRMDARRRSPAVGRRSMNDRSRAACESPGDSAAAR